MNLASSLNVTSTVQKKPSIGLASQDTRTGAKKRWLRAAGVYVAAPLFLYVLLIPVITTIQKGQSLWFIIPNAMLYFPLPLWTRRVWMTLKPRYSRTPIEPVHVPIVDAANFTYEALRKATNNFRTPAVIRGLVKDTPGYRLWPQEGYLAQQFGDQDVYVMKNYTNRSLRWKWSQDRELDTASVALTRIFDNPHSNETAFFPPLGRAEFLNHHKLSFIKQINDLILKDLELDKRLFPAFRNKIQWRVNIASQVFVARGNDKGTSGVNWHTEPGTNFYAMVHGKKRWYFVEPKYDAYMYPARGVDIIMITSQYDMSDHEPYIPMLYADLIAGDVLVNADFVWHRTQNNEGLIIAVPIRFINGVSILRNNPHFLSVFAINMFFKKVGFNLGGFLREDY